MWNREANEEEYRNMTEDKDAGKRTKDKQKGKQKIQRRKVETTDWSRNPPVQIRAITRGG